MELPKANGDWVRHFRPDTCVRPCLDLNVRPNESGGRTSPLCYPAYVCSNSLSCWTECNKPPKYSDQLLNLIIQVFRCVTIFILPLKNIIIRPIGRCKIIIWNKWLLSELRHFIFCLCNFVSEKITIYS